MGSVSFLKRDQGTVGPGAGIWRASVSSIRREEPGNLTGVDILLSPPWDRR